MDYIWENPDNSGLAENWVRKLQTIESKRKEDAKVGRRYYRNDNDIRRKMGMSEYMNKVKLAENPLRNADFRMAHNWHQLLVNQKASYLFSYPPVFESGDGEINKAIRRTLGSGFPRLVKNLAIEAANTGEGWLHIWQEDKGKLSFSSVPMEEVFPIYGSSLEREPIGVLRSYEVYDDDFKLEQKYEFWNDEAVVCFHRREGGSFEADPVFDRGNVFYHGLGQVPFIPFYNNMEREGDLKAVKDLIDQFDLVMSGFANDLADIQEVIFVLRNYGGEDLNTFLSELKRYKAIKVDGIDGGGGVETLNIEIPIEARVKFLELLKRQIFIAGQGVDPDPSSFGNSSGVALRYLYSLLEIKAGLLETEFRCGFDKLMALILRYLGYDENLEITQIYTRNGIADDSELADIAVKSEGILSRETVLKNHPWVEDAQKELELLDREKEDPQLSE